MSLGPVELLVIAFPGNQFTGGIAPALAELVDRGIVRIIDLVFVRKAEDGSVTAIELSDLGDDEYAAYDPIVSGEARLLSDDDVERIARTLPSNSSAGLMLFENAWATRFRDAVADAQGQVLISERIPRAVIEEVLAAGEQATA